jgi:glycosyltransferase involved in cell wall biosynthesis
LLADLPDLRLVLVGDGPLRQALGRLSQDLGISDRVVFAGKRDHAEVALWMNAADVFCLPSLREGHPNVVMEALACGTPVVASDVGAVSEILSSETGLLVPPANAQRLAEALRHAFRTPWNRERIRNSVEGSRWEDCAARYLDWYREILGGVLP